MYCFQLDALNRGCTTPFRFIVVVLMLTNKLCLLISEVFEIVLTSIGV